MLYFVLTHEASVSPQLTMSHRKEEFGEKFKIKRVKLQKVLDPTGVEEECFSILKRHKVGLPYTTQNQPPFSYTPWSVYRRRSLGLYLKS